MLTGVEVRHFKSWRASEWIACAPITMFFGSNSSGKTSLLQLLLLLKQTTESSDRQQVLNLGDTHSPVDAGTFPDLLHRHGQTQSLFWRIAWQLPPDLTIALPGRKNGDHLPARELAFQARIGWHQHSDSTPNLQAQASHGRAVVEEMAYQLAGYTLGMRLRDRVKQEYELYSDPAGLFSRPSRKSPRLPSPVKCYGFPDEVQKYYKHVSFLTDLEFALEQLCRRMTYLGPLREYPRRQYTWSGTPPTGVGYRGERVIEALLASRLSSDVASGTDSDQPSALETRVAEWLKTMELIADFAVRAVAPGASLFQVWVRRAQQAPEVLMTDVGFGISQMLPVITLCYYVPKGSIVILEHPEIHLHPRAQADLADVLIDAVKTRGVQIIVESHSEHLLRRLQRRIAEDVLPSDQAALYVCTTDAEGVSHIQRLHLDPYGNITNWPKDFFGDEMGDLLAMSEAAMKRQLGQV